jgi:sugar/nucleoside kinase (ribokinase family)
MNYQTQGFKPEEKDMTTYDLFAFGNISIDYIKTPAQEIKQTGGAVLYAAWVGHQLGRSVLVLTKTSAKDKQCIDAFPKSKNVNVHWVESKDTTSIRNDYQTASMETRICTNLGQADAYSLKDFPKFKARVIQYSGLVTGEIDLSIIKFLSKQAPLALDAQGLTRKVFPDHSMEFSNWDDKLDALPYVSYFKADAAEAQYLTGIKTEDHDGRVAAAKQFIEWGAKEIVISHNKELISANKDTVVFAPFKNRNLSGRTGRGDTSFASYITERLDRTPSESIKFAAALTSLKMENPGPFQKTRQDVEQYIKELYK